MSKRTSDHEHERLNEVRRFARRPLLQGIGAATAAALFPSLAPREARAQAGKPPTRFVLFWTSPGSFHSKWKPVAPAGMSAPSETAWQLGSLHAEALAPYKKHLVYLDGLEMKSNNGDPTPPANAHEEGQTHCLSAIDRAGGALPGGPSIDQYVAKELNKNGAITKFPSLEIDTHMQGYGHNHPISWVGRGQRAPIELDPRRAYTRLFGSGAAMMSNDQLAKQRAQDALLSDLLKQQYGALAPRMSRDDRMKLEAHSQAVSDLQMRLGLGGGGGGAGCRTLGSEVVATISDANHEKAFIARTEANTKMVAAALSCDLMRVVMLGLEEGPNSLYGYRNGNHGTTDIHDLFHKTSELNGQLRNDAGAVGTITNYYKFDAKVFAMLLKELASIPESDGQTLLDHTVVLWTSQIAEGGHNLKRLPWLIAGSAGGYFKTDRYMQYPGGAHNDLFVSVANAMGLPITSFGKASACKGPLPGLKA